MTTITNAVTNQPIKKTGSVDIDRETLMELLIQNGPNIHVPICLTEEEVAFLYDKRIESTLAVKDSH